MSDDIGVLFEALADPTRRWVVQALAGGATVTATSVARSLPLTRQAAAKHLAVLAEVGLVTADRSGRELRYRLQPQRLQAAGDWVRQVEDQWEDRVAALTRHLQEPD